MNENPANKISMPMAMSMTPRTVFFILFNILAAIIFYAPIKDLIAYSLEVRLYSHIVLVPFVSGYFIYSKRNAIFSNISYSLAAGISLIVVGIALYGMGRTQGVDLSQNDYLSLMTFSVLTVWIGGFVLFYGVQAFRIAAFPLLFLVFMIPIPSLMAEKIIFVLQVASAEATHKLFQLTGVPVFREGFLFHLPGMDIEVAKQCSGIRSSLSLFIVSILASHLFLRTGWRKGALVLSIIPITIVKNGMRIVTLSLLGVYVDPRILSSIAHQRGGIPFFIVALSILAAVLWFLRRSEKRKETG